MAFKVKDYDVYTRSLAYSNPYKMSGSFRPDKNVVNLMSRDMGASFMGSIPTHRSILDRVFDLIQTPLYATAGVVRGAIDDDISIVDGFIGGLRAGNPFGDGYEKGEHTYSKVLESAGWKPESGLGKFAKGAVGFVGDVLLDPSTYLSGGVSAFVKGTGKAGVALTHGGKIMTQELAESIIKNKMLKRGATASADDIAKEATKFVKEYNKLAGLREGSKEIIWSLGNAPLGNKIFGKYADKQFKVASAEGLAKLGDATLAPYYAKLRDKIYGSKFGEMFSTTSKIYQLSKTDPEAVYDLIQFKDITRGLKGDKLLMDKAIHERAKALNIPPHEMKQLRELMEDKTVWHKITKELKFLETAEAKRLRQRVEFQMQRDTEAMQNLLDAKKHIETLKTAGELKLEGADDILEALNKEYRQTLADIDLAHVTEKTQIEELLKAYQDELAEITKKIETQITPEKIGVQFDEYKKAVENIKLQKEQHKALIDIFRNPNDAEMIKQINAKDYLKKSANSSDLKYTRMMNSLDEHGKVIYKNKQYADKFAKDYPDWQRVKVGKESHFYPPQEVLDTYNAQKAKINNIVNSDPTLPQANRTVLMDNISEYLFGKKGVLSTRVFDEDLEHLVEMIKTGHSRDEVLMYVEQNADKFSGRLAEMYSFIGSKMGYGEKTRFKEGWKSMYHDRMKPLIEKMSKGEILTEMENKLLLQLDQLKYKRQLLINEFADAHTMDDVKKIIQKYKDVEIEEIFNQVRHMTESSAKKGITENNLDELRRGRFIDEDSALVEKGASFKPYDTEKSIKYLEDRIKRINLLSDDNIKTLQKRLAQAQKSGNVDMATRINKRLTTNERLSAQVDDWKRQIVELQNSKAETKGIKREVRGKNFKTGEFIDDVTYTSIKDDLLARVTKKPSDVTDARVRWAERIAKEADMIREKVFGVPYRELSQKQRKWLQDLAMNDEYKKSFGAGTDIGKAEHKMAIRQAKKKIEDLRINEVIRSTFKGSTVGFDTVDGKWRGVVDEIITGKDGKISYNIIDNEGKLIKDVKPGQITHVLSDGVQMSIDDLIKVSEPTKDFMAHHDDLVKAIDDAKAKLETLDVQYKTRYQEAINDFEGRIKSIQDNITKAQDEIASFKDALEKGDWSEIDTYADKIKKMEEVLASDDAFETYIRENMVDKYNEILEKNKVDTGLIALDARLDVSDKVKRLAKMLRAEFMDAGLSEVKIGKLQQGQFDEMLDRYLYHMLTPEGKAYFAKEVAEHGASLTDDLGFGQAFNNHSLSRKIKELKYPDGTVIKNPNIDQLNEYFKPYLKGQNAFVDNVADLYIARMLKHNELMYDHKYTSEMLEMFGHDFDGTIKEGYKIVSNYTMLKNSVSDIANLRVSMDISDAVSEHIRELIPQLKTQAMGNQSVLDDLIEKVVKQFIDVNYTDDVRKAMKQRHLDDVINQSGISKKVFDELATPMVELNLNQTKRLRDLWDFTTSDYRRRLDIRHSKALNYDNEKMLERVLEGYKRLEDVTPMQIKQVNEAIVQKANQARQLQIAKDQNRFLQMYDKFTHLIKLNQTAVLPAFHARNKLANTYLGWLGVGQDVFNADFQKSAWRAIRNEGNVDDVIRYIKPDGTPAVLKWKELYDMAEQYGVIDSGFFAKDIGANASGERFLHRLPAKFDPTDTRNFILYKKGTEVGSLIENSDKLLQFASHIKQGRTPEEAMELVNKFLFDYGDVTAFEQSVMKRIFPYYTWLKKNSILQLEQMLEQPEKFRMVSKVLGGIEGMVNEDERINKGFVNDFATDWIQTPFSVTNQDGRKEPVLWNPNLPFMDLSRIPNLFHPKGSVKSLFTQSNPLIKVPVEQAINRNVFFEQPIVDEGQSQLRRADHVLSQLGLYNVGKDAVTKDGLDLVLQGLNSTTGVKLLSYDYDKYKQMKIKELLKDAKVYRKGKSKSYDAKEGVIEDKDKLERIMKLYLKLFQ